MRRRLPMDIRLSLICSLAPKSELTLYRAAKLANAAAIFFGLGREERESAHLDALPRRGVWWRGGIFERRVGREPCAAVFLGIENFENQRLVAPHLRKIKPTVVGTILEAVSLSHAMRIASLGHDQIVHLYAFGVGKSEGICLDRLIDRAPHLNDREAVRQQGFGLVGESLAHAVGSGPFRIVVVRR